MNPRDRVKETDWNPYSTARKEKEHHWTEMKRASRLNLKTGRRALMKERRRVEEATRDGWERERKTQEVPRSMQWHSQEWDQSVHDPCLFCRCGMTRCWSSKWMEVKAQEAKDEQANER